MIVKFIDVGRGKMNWKSICESDKLDYDWLYDEVKKALMSENINFCEDGTILVGGFRPVGKFEVIEEE